MKICKGRKLNCIKLYDEGTQQSVFDKLWLCKMKIISITIRERKKACRAKREQVNIRSISAPLFILRADSNFCFIRSGLTAFGHFNRFEILSFGFHCFSRSSRRKIRGLSIISYRGRKEIRRAGEKDI